MDISFYDLELNRIYVLPSSSRNIGYRSMNCKIEFNGDGSLQISFWDKNLERLIKQHPEGLIVKWGLFEGFTTGYQNEELTKKIFGIHLNGMLYKSVIPAGDYSGNLETIAYETIKNNYSWIDVPETQGAFPEVTYKTDKPMQGNKFFHELTATGKTGYSLSMNAKTKRFVFQLLSNRDNPLRLSEDNRNAYEIKENFDGKNIAYGGWYEKETEGEGKTWLYIESVPKNGVYKQDVVLSAKNEEEAIKELKEHVADYKLTMKTRNIKFNTDYRLGENLKTMLDDNSVTVKTVTAVEMWHEKNEYNEQPVLGELKEVDADE